MIKKPITINVSSGLKDRPAAVLVQIASKYDSAVYLEADNGNKKINCKSIMGMMTLGLNEGEEVVVSADGEDEEAAINEIEKYLTNA